MEWCDNTKSINTDTDTSTISSMLNSPSLSSPLSYSSTTTTTTTSSQAPSDQPQQNHVSPPPPAVLPVVVMSPCAACKILRRRCAEKCVLAPYFPPTDPFKFTVAHRVFGASNIIKLLQELPECQRADAVSSMVYEANARLRDPVYGCAGAICHLQKQISELQAELAKAQAEIVNMQCQQANLLTLICMDSFSQQHDDQDQSMFMISQQPYENLNFFPNDDVGLSAIMEPLLT